ncbi:RimJ/RimL family protein N-acetyltransferase [Kribbella amoyensis]|uniref:RimJ/RimL family protein N-acetyltransferase n=1 Tax=Kribbella amoyensis TaxID=996641 RepID=A0A561B6U3_9ACTN|nr:GNAT family N-acetyltransferase [Kribbella amoyensis]TWD74705.1 RimJ/RimL family protein N-acetyltransferase [Kribbella amoyensis]
MPVPEQPPVLADGVVTLRAPEPRDLTGALERAAESGAYTAADIERWMAYGIRDAWQARTRLVFVIEYQGRYAGTVSLAPDPHGNASVHYGLARWAQGAGVAARAVRLILDFGFGTCGFHVVTWWARVGNWASRRVAWATGFHLGETIPAYAEDGGTVVDAWTGWTGPDDERRPRGAWFDVPVLEAERIRLRTWRDDELDRITTARTNQATAHFLPFIPQPFTVEDARFWLRDMAEQAAAGKRFNWCVADRATDVALGNVTLFGLHPDEIGDGELGYWAHPDAQGRGAITDAIKRIAEWYFATPDAGGFGGKKLLIRTAATNQAARRVAERSGFQHVGTERAAFPLLGGKLDDRVVYDLLPTDRSA